MLTFMTLVSVLCGGVILAILLISALMTSIIEVCKEALEALKDPDWWKSWLQ